MNIMAFIPARGGSKGIPRKNLVLLHGKPLIQYTIEAVRGCKTINDIFISSEDHEIISFCESLGVQVPYRRPRNLAADNTPLIDTILHAIDWMSMHGDRPDALVLLQPTSPLRNASHIDEAVHLFLSSGADTLFSVHEMIEHPYECLKISSERWSFLAKPDKEVHRRQDYKENFCYINGAIYLFKTDFLLSRKKIFSENETILYYMPAKYGIDIDTHFDLVLADCLMKNQK